jgi:catecholate siderophore receptor
MVNLMRIPHSLNSSRHTLPLAAMMLAGSMGSLDPAQAQPVEDKTLKTVTVQDNAEAPTLSKDHLLAKKTHIAKGTQSIQDIPQTVTVMTEKLMNDQNLDDFRKVLKATSGVTFQAGETGEEDVRMRGFSLLQSGDIYVDGLRDAPLIERDTFNLDRVEVLKGSASMLFGKGSTGGVINQVNKQPYLMDQNEVNFTVGSGNTHRITGDFNQQTGENSALRLNAMIHQADNWGANVDKKGIAPTYRWGIGERDEFSVGLFHLETDGRPLYDHPWLIDNGASISSANNSGKITPVLPAKNYYNLSSDFLRTASTYATLTHQHRFDQDSQLKTTVRVGHYQRDLKSGQVVFTNPITLGALNDSTSLTRRPKARQGESDLTQIQSDYNNTFNWLGHQNELLAGVDYVGENALRNNSATSGSTGSLTSTTTTIGAPDNGATQVDNRGTLSMMQFKAQTLGLYAQNMFSLTTRIKLVGGLRLDRFSAIYTDPNHYSISTDKNFLSPRLGMTWQPQSGVTHYVSLGTSYNTSGDAYLYGVGTDLSPTVTRNGVTSANTNLATLNTPAEKSRHVEIGSKYELFEGKGLLGVAAFHSEKFNERNTDPDIASSQYLLSGKRHASGMEFNFAGRITSAWEVFYNHTWIPNALIDISDVRATTSSGAPNAAQQQGDRPALTPKHSASLFTTYKLNPLWRVGAGVNYRGEQNPEGNRFVTAQAFTTVDALIEYVASDNTLVKLNVFNLTDKLYADSLYRGHYIPGAPRRIELSLKTLF